MHRRGTRGRTLIAMAASLALPLALAALVALVVVWLVRRQRRRADGTI